ncbi:cell wall metabolism sensor histidine kinase WalK [Streptomyces sp. TLI_171]|uniref:sensor histidine kinase n=1 Tax=Streptomyces sp. TLI_171 TaxID=1938859 RepID=UPI000C198BAF|nr:HAMP domain-containing sensor histidine kinase [Streptomyces sp. TLI_171]RKE20389.1 two-component system OmpR family sensor kinase [Streptomyces sp. TLI_171]
MARFSLRVRLLVLALLLVTTGLVLSDTLVLGTVRGQLVGRADQQLGRFAEPLSRRAPSRQTPVSVFSPQSVTRRAAQSLPSEYVVRYLGADGEVLSVIRQPVSDSDPAPQLPNLNRAALAKRENEPYTTRAGRGVEWRTLVLPLQRTTGTDAAAPRYVQVAVPLEEVESTISHLRTTFFTIGAAVLVGIAGLGAIAVRAGLRPLRQLEAGAQRIADGDLSHRMPELPARTEAGRLSAALNGMLAHIEKAFADRAASEQRMRRFVADASHELRTPLAGIRGFAELHRMGALQDVDRAMDRIESEAVRMGGLVEDLLTLARLDEERPLNLAPMDLRTLAADALHDLTALDPGRPVALTGPNGEGAPQPAPVLGDEARLRQVVTNLVGNAVKHTPPGTAVRIGVGRADGGCLLEVADHGPGLTEDQAALVFERFYRADASRSRRAGGGGGAGLGLAIATALVSAHGGELTLHTAPGEGAAFRMSLPRQR